MENLVDAVRLNPVSSWYSHFSPTSVVAEGLCSPLSWGYELHRPWSLCLRMHLGTGLQFPLSLWDHLELVIRACFSHPLNESSNVAFSNQPLWDFSIPLQFLSESLYPSFGFLYSSFWGGISVLLSVSSCVPPIWRLSDISAGSDVCFTLWFFLTGLGAGSVTSFMVVIRHLNKSNLGEKGFIRWITIPEVQAETWNSWSLYLEINQEQRTVS